MQPDLLLLLFALLPYPHPQSGLPLLLEVDVGHEAHGAVPRQLIRLVRQGQLGDHPPLDLVFDGPEMLLHDMKKLNTSCLILLYFIHLHCVSPYKDLQSGILHM